MAKVLVTGATGFVGRVVTEELRSQGHEVSTLARRGAVTHRVDLAAGAPPQAFEGVDTVVHLAGTLRRRRENTLERANVDATRNALAAERAAGIRKHIHLSALGTRPGARTLFHRTKWESERLVRDGGIRYAIFRSSFVYGGPPAGHFIESLLGLVRRPVVTLVPGSGLVRLQPIHVRDVARFVSDGIANARTDGRVVNIGGPKVLTLEQMIEILTRALMIRKVHMHVPRRALMPPAWILERIADRPPVTVDELRLLGEDQICDTTDALDLCPMMLRDFRDWVSENLSPP